MTLISELTALATSAATLAGARRQQPTRAIRGLDQVLVQRPPTKLLEQPSKMQRTEVDGLPQCR
jgi:hypothetical protein